MPSMWFIGIIYATINESWCICTKVVQCIFQTIPVLDIMGCEQNCYLRECSFCSCECNTMSESDDISVILLILLEAEFFVDQGKKSQKDRLFAVRKWLVCTIM